LRASKISADADGAEPKSAARAAAGNRFAAGKSGASDFRVIGSLLRRPLPQGFLALGESFLGFVAGIVRVVAAGAALVPGLAGGVEFGIAHSRSPLRARRSQAA
jgi:hypothetical protein